MVREVLMVFIFILRLFLIMSEVVKSFLDVGLGGKEIDFGEYRVV